MFNFLILKTKCYFQKHLKGCFSEYVEVKSKQKHVKMASSLNESVVSLRNWEQDFFPVW